MQATVTIAVRWHGPSAMRALHNHLKIATILATKDYYVTLKRLLDKWGSVREFVHNVVPIKRSGRTIALRRTRKILGNMRRRLVHSSGGTPPRRQTGNLYESIRWNVDFKGPTLGNFEGTIWTDVPYAPELEYGGTSQNYLQVNKKYTRERLINPIPKWAYYIAPRPAWSIAFFKAYNQMLSRFTITATVPFSQTVVGEEFEF